MAAAKKKLSKLQARLADKLSGAKFRWLNEQMYTSPGHQSFELLQQDPALFTEYHAGFSAQVRGWPVNPLDIIIKRIMGLPKSTVVADFGCGEARLAATVPHKTHSFDLVAGNERITACDVANVPLEDSSVDVAVFCLALMGTDYFTFLTEARRVLKHGGLLLIAEVSSRFNTVPLPSSHAGEAAADAPAEVPALSAPIEGLVSGLATQHRAGVGQFTQALADAGFLPLGVDDSNTHFITMQLALDDPSKPASCLPPPSDAAPAAPAPKLKKARGGKKGKKGRGNKRPRTEMAPPVVPAGKIPRTGAPPPALKPCIYKRR